MYCLLSISDDIRAQSSVAATHATEGRHLVEDVVSAVDGVKPASEHTTEAVTEFKNVKAFVIYTGV